MYFIRTIRLWHCGLALLVVSSVLGQFAPAGRSFAILGSLAIGLEALWSAWRGAMGTALRPSVVWAFATWVFTILALLVALGEPADTGRPWANHLTYLASLCALGAAVSMLNARRPGAGVWAMLTTMLIVVLLIPWVEGIGLARGAAPLARLRLEAPWSIFYALLATTAVLNHLPTLLFGPALVMGLGWGGLWLALQAPSPARLAGQPEDWGFAVAAALVFSEPLRWKSSGPPSSGLECLWLWFADRWGMVWALRVQERFNRTAEASGWPIRLGQRGVVTVGGDAEVPPAALPTLIALLGRFATRERLEAEAAGGVPCGPSGVDRS